VSVTYTLNDWFGAGVMASKTGVILNDEMDDFTSKIGVPNMYGLVQGEANAIAPGKAPLSSMSPTIVTKDGKVVMVVGTPGGSRIITATLLTMLNVIDYDMNIQEAVDAPRFHQQWLPEETNLEAFTTSPDTVKISKAGATSSPVRRMPTTWRRSWSARHLWVANRSATTVSTGRTTHGVTPGCRWVIEGCVRKGTGLCSSPDP